MPAKMFALLSKQGTACSETGLCDLHFTDTNRDRIEDEALRNVFNNAPEDIPVTPWHEVTNNPEIECVQCLGQEDVPDKL